jgi:DNA-3-methyladenine glycosylase II
MKARHIILKPIPPFNFDGTVYVPAYFPTPDYEWRPGTLWRTLNCGGKLLGLKLEQAGSIDEPEINLTVFSEFRLSSNDRERIVGELGWRYGLEEDISDFSRQFEEDRFLGPVLRKWRGMRANCSDSLYELLVVSILLQNATVRRTVQMMNNLFNNYGTKLRFDKKELFVYWGPERLAEVKEEVLRALKLGYRAKMVIRVSQAFADGKIDEAKLRTMGTQEVKKELMKLYGVGPATAQILLTGYFRRYDTFELKGRRWEQKILSRIFFGRKSVSPEKIIREFNERYGKWRGLAFHYVFTDLFWRHSKKKIPWLEREIRL